MNKRQETVWEFIGAREFTSTSEIHEYLSGKLHEKVARITVIRDVDFLIRNGLVKSEGQARSIKYSLSNPLLRYIDVDDYFQNDCDYRVLKNENFNFEIFKHLRGLFTKEELERTAVVNEKFHNRTATLSPTLLKKEFERLTIEFSWKSSRIEGNTYSLLDTERLIRENIEAAGHSRKESLMIVNHKRTLDYILEKVSCYNSLTLAKIEDLHRILTDGLDVHSGLRFSPVGIVGTKYRPPDNIHQIRDAVIEMIEVLNSVTDPFERAFLIVLMISYIQPFEDGNKRTSRILANAVLLAGNYCPLSYRSIDEVEYKRAVILFYEQNSVVYLKKLFTEQFEQAVRQYFG